MDIADWDGVDVDSVAFVGTVLVDVWDIVSSVPYEDELDTDVASVVVLNDISVAVVDVVALLLFSFCFDIQSLRAWKKFDDLARRT